MCGYNYGAMDVGVFPLHLQLCVWDMLVKWDGTGKHH